MIKRLLALAVAALLSGLPAAAQSVLEQAGPWAPGHIPQYVGQGFTQPFVQDGGGAGGGGLGANPSELSLTVRSPTGTYPAVNAGTGPLGTNFCDYDAPTNNASGYHYLCLSPNAQGGGLIAYGAGGVAEPLPLQILVNGVLIDLGAGNDSGILSVIQAPYGWVRDGQSAATTWTAGSTAISGITGKPGQMFAAPGVGPNGGPFQTTFQSTNQLAAAPTYSSGTWYATSEECPVATPGTGVVPGDTFTIGGGAFNAPSICTVLTTGVYAATKAAAGTGAGADGSQCVVTGTTGQTSGPVVPFAALVSILNGGIDTVIETDYPGQYSTNPTVLSNEPVKSISPACINMTGAALSVQMGVNLGMLYTPGNSPTQPPTTQTPTATSGGATGVTFSILYAQSNTAFWGTDNLTAIHNTMALTSGVELYVPQGTYMMSCEPSANYLTAASSISFVGVFKQSIIQLAPGCKQTQSNSMFVYNGKSGVHWRDMTLDFNNSTFSNYNPLPRVTTAGILLLGNGKNARFTGDSFLNMRSGQNGLQGFWSTGQVFDNIDVENSYCTENTRNGNISHCFYFTHAVPASITNITFAKNTAIGANVTIQVDGFSITDNDVCCEGYGGAINIGPGPASPATNGTFARNRLHDASNVVEVGDADIPSGSEAYGINTVFDSNIIYNMPGAGLTICAQHDTVVNNKIYDNGGARGPNTLNGGQKWQLNAGIVLINLHSPIFSCVSSGAHLVGNQMWDSYTWAAANGQSTAGLSPTQFYGISNNGITYGVSDINYLSNDVGYNAFGFTPQITSAAIVTNGSGFGVSATGTMTWAGAGCTTPPVLNVGSNVNGIIGNVVGFADHGVCTVIPPASATTWTPGGGLSPGTGASFALLSASNPTGAVFINGTEKIDSFTSLAIPSRQLFSWAAATVTTGATNYTIGAQANTTGATQFVNGMYAQGRLANLTARVVTAAVGSTIDVTIYAGRVPGPAAGNLFATPLACSIQVGDTTCTINTTASRVNLPAGTPFVAQIVNNSSSSTGGVTINFEYDQVQ